MPRTLALLPLAACAFALSGCVAGMAASAVGMAAQAAQGRPQSNQHLSGAAEDACTAAASRHGAVAIIDVEQRSPSKIVVWGTVDDGSLRRAFECSFGTKVTDLKLRPINR